MCSFRLSSIPTGASTLRLLASRCAKRARTRARSANLLKAPCETTFRVLLRSGFARALLRSRGWKRPATGTPQPLGHISSAKAHIRMDLEMRNGVALDIPVDRLGANRQDECQFLGREQSFASREPFEYIDRVVQRGYGRSEVHTSE